MQEPNIKSGQIVFVFKMTQYQLYNVSGVNGGHFGHFWPRGVPWEGCLSGNGHFLRLLGGEIGVKGPPTCPEWFLAQPATIWGWSEHFSNDPSPSGDPPEAKKWLFRAFSGIFGTKKLCHPPKLMFAIVPHKILVFMPKIRTFGPKMGPNNFGNPIKSV